MQEFRVDEEQMDLFREIIVQLNTELTEAHGEFKALIADIEQTASWKGKSKERFLVYMRLLEQYHGALASVRTTQPVFEAVKALEGFMYQIDTFYRGFTEYKAMEGD
ncbi:MAG: hypothetical protein K2O34_00820 [Acetatifactor sp.]|nr:hypothetical protein [Acetatifactor sp.]